MMVELFFVKDGFKNWDKYKSIRYMRKITVLIGIIAFLISCSAKKNISTPKNTSAPKTALVDANTFNLTEISKDTTYGLTPENPVKVGGVLEKEGPLNERRFLNALAGPNNEIVLYYREGSCCPIKTEHGMGGMGMLDNYSVTWEGSKDTVSIYINMYDYGELKAPVGFRIREITSSPILEKDNTLSALPDNSKENAKKVVDKFIKALKGKKDITSYLKEAELNYGGQLWMPSKQIESFIRRLIPSKIKTSSFNYYTFDEVEQDSVVKKKAIKLRRVYNNYSILALGTLNEKKISLILQPKGDSLKIACVDLPSILQKKMNNKETNQVDTLKNLGIILQIPEGFLKEVGEEESQITYIMKGQTPRDAVIQILYFEKRVPSNILITEWVDYITSQYRKSEYEIKYLSNGYMYSYELIDSNGDVNKGISVAIENSEHSFVIQYFGFKEAYNKLWREIDEMIRNVKEI